MVRDRALRAAHLRVVLALALGTLTSLLSTFVGERSAGAVYPDIMHCENGCSGDAFVGAERAHDSANTAARAANGLWITGAVLGASAVSLYFLAPRLSREERRGVAHNTSLRVATRGPGALLELGGKF